MARTPLLTYGPTFRLFRVILLTSVCLAGVSHSAIADDYAELIRRGQEAREAEDFRTAVAVFRKAIAQQPDNSTAYIEAAETCSEAYVHFNASLDIGGRSLWLAPRDWKTHAKPEHAFSLIGLPEFRTEPVLDGTVPIEIIEVHRFAIRATELAPEKAHAWRLLGRAYSAIGDYENAIASLERATELDPSDAAIWHTLGAAYALKADYRSAKRFFEVASRLAPSNTDYRSDHGNCRRILGDRESAEDFLAAGLTPASVEVICGAADSSNSATNGPWQFTYADEMCRLQPHRLHWRSARAEAAMSFGNHQAALKDAEFALSKSPEQAEFLVWRWAALYGMKRYDEALETATQGQQLRPYLPQFALSRVVTLQALGRDDEARTARQREAWLAKWFDFRPKLIDTPNRPDVWLEGGRLALEGAEYDAAKTCFDKALALDPDSLAAHDGLAQLHLALDKPQDALAAIERVIELDPKAGDPRSTRAEIHLALGDFDAAIVDYEAALKTGHAFGPQVAEAYLRRAEHREATGDTAGAASDRKHAEALRANPFGVPSN